MKSSDIHSVLFDINNWDTLEARKWLKNHNLKPIKNVHKTEHFLRYRIKDPSIFTHFITKTIDHGKGIKIIIGFY